MLVPSIYPVAGPLEPWVREAVDRGIPESQLELHYQPVVRSTAAASTGPRPSCAGATPSAACSARVNGFRMRSASGAAVSLCAAVLPAWAACARRLPGLVLSFNVGGQDLADDGYMASMHAVAAAGAAGLAVEVPYLQFHAGAARRRPRAHLASLQALGVSVWMDNFGCGGVDDETAAVGSTVDVVKLDMSLLGGSEGGSPGWSNGCTTTARSCSSKASSPPRTSSWRSKRAWIWPRATATPHR